MLSTQVSLTHMLINSLKSMFNLFLFLVQHTEYYIKHGEKKAIRRKIFERVQYDEFERQCLVEFKEMIAQHKFVVPPK